MAKILVVEDEPDIQMLVKLTLEHAGHVVSAAGDGEAAVAAAIAEAPDALILDVNLPGMNGLETCRRLREAGGKLKSIPVLFLSVRGADHEVRAAFEAGATEYLVKPFALEDLVGTVAKLLAPPAASADNLPPSNPAPPQPPAPAAPPPAQTGS